MKNIISGYRKMIGLNQSEMASILGISRQSYSLKENGKINFSDNEKVIFKEKIKMLFPQITIDDIFFNHGTEICKEEVK